MDDLVDFGNKCIEKDKLLDTIKRIKNLECVCDIEKSTGLNFNKIYPVLREIELDGNVKLHLGCPERCIGVSLVIKK